MHCAWTCIHTMYTRTIQLKGERETDTNKFTRMYTPDIERQRGEGARKKERERETQTASESERESP